MPWYGKSAHFAARTVPGSKKVNFLRYQYFAKLLITSKRHTPFNYVFTVQCTEYIVLVVAIGFLQKIRILNFYAIVGFIFS